MRTRQTHEPRRISPALVLSVIALVVALGGSAFASGLIDGRDIRPNSIGAGKLKRALRRKIDAGGQSGIPGAVGQRGEPGATGARGPAAATSFAIVAADGSVVEQQGVPVVTLTPDALGGPVFSVGFSADVTNCPISISVVDSSPSGTYADIPDGYGTARLVPEYSYPAFLPGIGAGYNVRIWQGGAGVALPFEIAALCQ